MESYKTKITTEIHRLIPIVTTTSTTSTSFTRLVLDVANDCDGLDCNQGILGNGSHLERCLCGVVTVFEEIRVNLADGVVVFNVIEQNSDLDHIVEVGFKCLQNLLNVFQCLFGLFFHIPFSVSAPVPAPAIPAYKFSCLGIRSNLAGDVQCFVNQHCLTGGFA